MWVWDFFDARKDYTTLQPYWWIFSMLFRWSNILITKYSLLHILPQPLMLDVLQALQSSEYSYILNAAHSDTLAVILQNLFSFNTFLPHLLSSWCPKQKVLNCLYYVYALSFSRIATVASLPHQRSHYFLQMFLTALGLYHDPEDLTAEDIGTGYKWDTSR